MRTPRRRLILTALILTPAEAWSRTFGTGRSFYTSLGHRDDIWSTDEKVRAHRKTSPDLVFQDVRLDSQEIERPEETISSRTGTDK